MRGGACQHGGAAAREWGRAVLWVGGRCISFCGSGTLVGVPSVGPCFLNVVFVVC